MCAEECEDIDEEEVPIEGRTEEELEVDGFYG